MTESPLRFMEYAVTMAEAPEEISLTIAVSNCAFRCSGCHSAYLWEDKGVLLLPVLPRLIRRYSGLVSCVCFMGEGQNPTEQRQALVIVRGCGQKTCLYSGCDSVQPFERLLPLLDYLKIGHYDKKLGGLDSKGTNQRFYRVEKGKLIDQTTMFQGRKEEHDA